MRYCFRSASHYFYSFSNFNCSYRSLLVVSLLLVVTRTLSLIIQSGTIFDRSRRSHRTFPLKVRSEWQRAFNINWVGKRMRKLVMRAQAVRTFNYIYSFDDLTILLTCIFFSFNDNIIILSVLKINLISLLLFMPFGWTMGN